MEVLNFLIDFFTNYGYIAVFLVLIACGFGLPLPEDITLIAGGVICALSEDESTVVLNFKIMIVVALCGVLLGDSVMFFLGRVLGNRVHRLPILKKIITPAVYAQIQEKVHKYGIKILFIARFLPGLRAPIYLTAGISHKVSYLRFIIMDGIAAIISVPLLIYLGYFFAQDISNVIKWVKKSETFLLLAVMIVIFAFILYKVYQKNKKL